MYSNVLSYFMYIAVYADMSDDDCNSLDFALGHTGVGATIPTRSFSIKVYMRS